jgi:DNA-binding HxlR family transcriptional regulator
MDARTQQMMDALKHPGGTIVFKLLQKGPMTEDELVQEVRETSQATMNRRLEELGQLGILSRAPGPRQYRERPWQVTVEAAADSLLSAVLELSEAVGSREREDRKEAREGLREGRKRRSSLREVEEGNGEVP